MKNNETQTIVMDRRREAGLLKVIRNRFRPLMWIPYAGLWLLSRLYWLGWAWTHFRRRGIPKQKIQGAVVLGIGNITMGGAGKTPVAAYLAGKLSGQGKSVGIALRGYKRQGNEDIVILKPKAPDDDAFLRAGDEAALLSRLLPHAAIGVGVDRAAAARGLVSDAGVNVVILDDAFQYITLHRDLNILVMDATCPFGFGALAPAGTLREPIGGLKRADLIWITRADEALPDELERIQSTLKLRFPAIPVLFSRHKPLGLKKVDNFEDVPLDSINGKSWVLAAGIGNPDSFLGSVAALGGQVKAALWYPDHHEFTRADVEEISGWVLRANAKGAIVTEKDAVRLGRLGLEPGLFFMLSVGIDLDPGSEEVLDAALEKII